MTASLRAFFMLHSEDGAWDISVYQTLEEVIKAWEHRAVTVDSAVLHVGFERRAARNFDDAILRHPGRVLLTPGAKGALPRSFRSSANPIASVEDEPVFLALDGWGYAETEPAFNATPALSPKFSDWIEAFVTAHPEHGNDLAATGIFSESDYLALEQTLSPDIRRELGAYRFHALCRTPDDPTDMARAAPPWLQRTLLNELNLTVRIANVFHRLTLKKVGDLTAFNVSDLLELKNFGRNSVRDLGRILNEAVVAGPHETRALHVSDSHSLLDAVAVSLETCDARERDILTRRMGLNTKPETLNEIGDRFSVTRERIRQIESKCIKRLIRQEVWDDVLAEKLKHLLAEREFPLPLIGVEALDPWFAGVGRHRHTMRYLIENMTETNVAIVEIGGVAYLSFLNQDAWSDLLASARQLLAGGVDHGWLESECRNNVEALVPRDANEFRSLLWDQVSRWCQFADDDTGDRQLVAYGRGANQIVEAVLAESDEPVHYSEIPSLVEARGGRPIDERRAHSAAAEVGYLFGRGRYGTLKHLATEGQEWEAIADEAAEIVAEGPQDRQWHTSELLAALIEQGVPVPETFDKYQLDIILKVRGDLHSLGRMVWSDQAGPGGNARVDIRQAVIALIQKAGEPLSTSDLRQRLIAVRGIDQGMQLHATEPLIKLDSQIWGLNDRDLNIKRSDQPAFLNRVAARLRDKGHPMSFEECAKAFGNEIPPRALYSLAASDCRFAVTPDRHLRLADEDVEMEGASDGQISSAAI